MQQTQLSPGRILMIGLFMIPVVILADQYTKWLVLETVLRAGEHPGFGTWFVTPRPLSYFIDQQESYATDTLAPFLNFVMVWNKGVSFGMFDNNTTLPLVLIGLSLAISGALLAWMFVMKRLVICLATGLIVGGALGNVVDRIRFSAVADFIDFHIGDRHWPAFNVADSCVVIGAALLVADALLAKGKDVPVRA
jgi:signal peptidase II